MDVDPRTAYVAQAAPELLAPAAQEPTNLRAPVSTYEPGAGITPRERLFIHKYLSGGMDEKEAAIACGFKARQGFHLMMRPDIKAELLAGMGLAGMAPQEIVARLTKQARASMEDFIDVDESGYARVNFAKAKERGALMHLGELSYDANALPKIKLKDSESALDKLAKIQGMYTERVEINTTSQVEINISKRVMVAALGNPEILAQLGELADRVGELPAGR